MKTIDLIRFFIGTFYRLPEQTFVKVVMILFGVSLVFQVHGLETFLIQEQPFERFITVNIILTFIVMILAMGYFANSLLLKHDEYEQLIYLPIQEREVISAKMVSSVLIPVSLGLVIQLLAFTTVLSEKGLDSGLRYLAMLIAVLIVTGSISLLQIGIVSLLERLFQSRLLYVIFYSLFIIVTWGLLILISLIRIGFDHFSVEGLQAGFSSIANALVWLDELLLGIPFIETLRDLVVMNTLGTFIIAIIGLLILSAVLVILARELLAGTYRRNGQTYKKIETKTMRSHQFSANQSILYLQREHLINKEYGYFMRQLYITYAVPVLFAIMLVFFKPYVDRYFNVPFLDTYFFMTFSYILLLTNGMNVLVGAAYSKEGVMHASIKYLPMDEGLIYRAKARYLTIWSALCYAVGYLIYFIGQGFEPLAIPMFVYFVLLSYVGYLTGMLVDRRQPIIDWEKPTAAMKNNMNGMVGFIVMSLILGVFLTVHLIGIAVGLNDYVVLGGLIVLLIVFIRFLENKFCK